MVKSIPLLDFHKTIGASIGEFAGFRTPIVYTSISEEHMSVRENVGIFDISHMAMIRIKGPEVEELLEKAVPKKISGHKENKMLGPTLFLNENGGIKDDIMTYKISTEEWIIVGNAVNTEKDLAWINSLKEKFNYKIDVIEYLNEKYSLLAIQGPSSPDFVEELNKEALELKPLEFIKNPDLNGLKGLILSRSGWTGEDGFEIIAEHKVAKTIFETMLNKKVKPCGLAARDTLRLEMGYVLYGQDIDESTSPIEARYWMAFDTDKQDCIGCSKIREKMREGVNKTRVGLKLSKKEKSIPRHGMYAKIEDTIIGEVTSGGYSPYLKRPIGMGYIKTTHSLMGMQIEIEIRGKNVKAKITDFPLIKKK